MVLLLFANPGSHAQEFRGLWVDAFGPGFRSAEEVTQLIADARAGNFNALVVEIRKRGDAYYNSNFEPKALDISPASFDPLADLIAKGHNTNGGLQRIEIHAWIVTYPIWNNANINAAPATHPIRLHPDWLSQQEGGQNFEGNYLFDPAHPAVQQHTFNVCMDIVSRYDVDGLNFDYVRYYGNNWGYNPVAVQRFNDRFNRTGQPARTDADWMQFRRDQVTALVRKTYLSCAAIKPQVAISADTITFAPFPSTIQAWTNSSGAYVSVLQDWRSWMQEGILDLNIPMAYFRMHTHPNDWFGWCNFIRDHQYNRQAAIGPGLYLNTFSNTLFQMRHTRATSPAGNTAMGVVGYDYGQQSNDGTSRATFLDALTKTNVAQLYDPNPSPLFVNKVPTPTMPWKVAPTKGHIKGFVYLGNTNTSIDGARLTITGGGGARNTISDATGFYGSVDLAPGTYTILASNPNAAAAASNVTVVAGAVVTANFILTFNDSNAPVISGIQAIDISDRSARIVWNTDEPSESVVQFGTSVSYDRGVTNTALVQPHSLQLSSLLPATTYHYRVISKDNSGNEAVSADFVFQTNPTGVVNDLIVDNPQATIVGSWSSGNSAVDKYGSDYRFESPGTGAGYVHFAPNILTAGSYEVHEWHSVGGNRTLTAPHQITHKNGTTNVIVNQRLAGGRWNSLGTFMFNAGSTGYVRITDGFSETTNVVIADAIKFVFVPSLPVIVVNPADRAVTAGQSVSFTVIASGTPPFTYQWRFDHVDILGATFSSLAVTNVDGFDAGLYRALVSNSGGSALSSNAALTVLPSGPPEILTIDGQVRLTVSGEAGFNYTLMSSSNLVDWLDLQSVRPAVNPFQIMDTPDTSTRFYKLRRD